MQKIITFVGAVVSMLAVSQLPQAHGLSQIEMQETLDGVSRLLKSVTSADRNLAAVTKTDCDTFLALTLSPIVQECSDMSNALQALQPGTDAQCTRVIDVSAKKLDAVCHNKCHAIMVDALGKMAKSGCAPDGFIKNMCDQCPGGTTCVGGACRPSCSAKSPCKCKDTCVKGACMPSDASFQGTDMGTYGLKVSMETLCLTPPDKGASDYCMSSVLTAIDGLKPGVCDRITATGCCAGTVLQFGRNCALANETIGTSMGPVKLSDIEAFCPAVDFTTQCTNAPVYPQDSCLRTYVDGPGVELPFPGKFTCLSCGYGMDVVCVGFEIVHEDCLTARLLCSCPSYQNIHSSWLTRRKRFLTFGSLRYCWWYCCHDLTCGCRKCCPKSS